MTTSMIAILIVVIVITSIATATIVTKLKKDGTSNIEKTLSVLSIIADAVSEVEDLIMVKAPTMTEGELISYSCKMVKSKIESNITIPQEIRDFVSNMDMERFFQLIKRYLIPVINKAYAQIEKK